MKSILIAEDDRTTRELLHGVLKAAGYAVATAADGRQALKRLQRKRFDLLLTDIWMPHLNGLELLGRLREQDGCPRTLVMTSDDTPETVLRAVREQAYQYIQKPIESKQLEALVADALAADPSSPPIEIVSLRPDWVELLVSCQLTAAERIGSFMAALRSDLPQEVRERIGQAFRELLTNAIEWGGKFDPNQKVRISYVRARRMLLYRIADPGKGFHFEELSHAALGNPVDKPFAHDDVRTEKGLRPGGFGILMVRSVADELIYNEAHNEVIFVKYLDA